MWFKCGCEYYTVEKIVVVMDTPSSFIAHEYPLIGMEECLALLGCFSSPLSILTG